jgi:uncharacterized protein (TIGR00730 family)
MHPLSSVAVFCGSSSGFDPRYNTIAHEVGAAIAATGARVVYGGARVGLMGAVANGALEKGGQVVGVIPDFLETKEIAHTDLTQLIIVATMHERKLKMHELSDAIIALPGGWGTMEELTEMLTWAQLGLHAKPMGLLNAGRFYDGLLQLVSTMVSQGFLKPEHASMLIVREEIQELLDALARYVAPPLPKWIAEADT